MAVENNSSSTNSATRKSINSTIKNNTCISRSNSGINSSMIVIVVAAGIKFKEEIPVVAT